MSHAFVLNDKAALITSEYSNIKVYCTSPSLRSWHQEIWCVRVYDPTDVTLNTLIKEVMSRSENPSGTILGISIGRNGEAAVEFPDALNASLGGVTTVVLVIS